MVRHATSSLTGDMADAAAAMLDRMEEGAYAVDRQGRLVIFNAAAERFFGRSRCEVLGRVAWDVLPAVAATLVESQCRQVLEQGREMEFGAKPSDPAQGRSRARAFPLAGGVGVFFRPFRDEAGPEWFRRAFDHAAMGLEWLSADGIILHANRYLGEILGYPPERLIGRSFRDLTLPQDLTEEEPLLARLRQGLIASYTVEKRYRHRSGAPVWVRVTSSLAGRDPDAPRISMVEDITARRHAEQSLRESESRLSAIVGQATVGMAQLDLQGRFVFVNDRFCQLAGRTRNELLGQLMWEIAHPDDRDRNLEAFGQAAGSVPPLIIEQRQIRPDGGIIWVSNSMTPLKTPEGQPWGVFAVTVDITERRIAEERQHLLIREVDHRAKNALAVVQALVRLTRADTVKDFVQAVEGRVSSLARTHTLLASNQWSGVDLRTLVEGELAPYATTAGHGLRLEGPPVWLEANAAQPMGVAIHELATNAVKHGALSTGTGTIAISWRREDAKGLMLIWTETGGEPIQAPPRRGFGATMIDQSICYQLGGAVEMDWRPDGLRCTLHIPERFLVMPPPARCAAPPVALPHRSSGEIAGRRILLVEDEGVQATATAEILTELGCTVIGPLSGLAEAVRMAAMAPLDGALLDVNVRGRSVFPVAEILDERGTPFLFTTGYGDPGWGNRRVPVLRKPFRRQDLAQALHQMLAGAPVPVDP